MSREGAENGYERAGRMKTIVDDVMAKRKETIAQLTASEAANKDLQNELAKKEQDNILLRRTLIESVGGISFDTFDKSGKAHVHVRKDIGESEKYDVQVGQEKGGFSDRVKCIW